MINKSTFVMIKMSYLKIEHKLCYNMHCLSLLKMVLRPSFESIRDTIFCNDSNIKFKIDQMIIYCVDLVIVFCNDTDTVFKTGI